MGQTCRLSSTRGAGAGFRKGDHGRLLYTMINNAWEAASAVEVDPALVFLRKALTVEKSGCIIPLGVPSRWGRAGEREGPRVLAKWRNL